MPPYNTVPGLCPGKRQGGFMDTLVQHIITEHLVVAGTCFLMQSCGEKATNDITKHIASVDFAREEEGWVCQSS